MKTAPTQITRLTGFLLLFFLFACNRNKTLNSSSANKQPNMVKAAHYKDETTTLTTITTKDYEVKIYGAFAFDPAGSTSSLIAPERGHHFVVLDLSVENTSVNKTINMGQILLSTKVMDERGNVYPQNALAVHAFEMEYPEPGHDEQYRAMKGKIGPGSYYRTTAYGFEAPVQLKNFVFTLDEESNIFNLSKIKQAAFSLE